MLSDLIRVFDFGGQWGSATVRLVEGSNASLTIKKVESMLEDSMKLLKSHEKLLSTRQYNSFTIKHRRLLLKVIEIKKEVHDQQAAGSVDKQIYDTELARIYDQTEIYHRDVITASRRAQLDEENCFFETPKETESASADATWYSVIAPQSISEETSDRSTLVNKEPFIAVAHVRETNQGNDIDHVVDDAYRRILIMESKDKRMIMIDPNLCYLEKEDNPINESTLLEMSRAGETLLKATELDGPKGYEVIGKAEEPSWIDSLIDTMARLGAGVSTTTV